MKSTLILLITLSPVFSFCETGASKIFGTWLTQIEDAKIEIYQQQDKFFGKVVWIAEPNDDEGKPKTDEYNPNPNLTNRPILGIDILVNFTYKNGEWSGGQIYDPKKGEFFAGKLWVENGNLMVRGYLGFLFDTKTWTRVK